MLSDRIGAKVRGSQDAPPLSMAEKLLFAFCAAALVFEKAGVTEGRRVTLHPMAKPAIVKGCATDQAVEVDGPLFTARDEHAIGELLPYVEKALK